ncbi:PREDICTED: proteasome subunit alpha type-5 [Propithecus coquereli]|uniref:proteasome subunit alpha type-5 n=1 Tax=Propithecus coquereli TaxID=379532 RepID=UPI00063F66EF|nr:PREDICTED: proteasome subunit alpha type-5 [Propithecus coquereli]
MFLTRSEYDRGVNTFSPEGRLFQVEYAIEAIKLGSTAIGIQTSEGVCLAVEKRITSPLMEPSSIEKIVEIDAHIGKESCSVGFHMDPSGTFVQCDARAIGSASEGAQSSLQEVYHKLATVQPGQNFHMFTKEELEEVIKDI